MTERSITQRPLWDLLQPTWVDRMGAAAWAPPSLPLSDNASSAPTDGISTKPAGQMASFSGMPQFARPMPPEWPNFIPGPAAPLSTLGPAISAQIFGSFLPQRAPVRNLATGGSSNSEALRPTASFNERWPEPFDFGPQMPPQPQPPDKQQDDGWTPEKRRQHCALDAASIAADYANRLQTMVGKIDPVTGQLVTQDWVKRQAAEMQRTVERIQTELGCPPEMY